MSRNSSPVNILIADDHCLFLEGLKHQVYCVQPNAEITCATNGADALSRMTGKDSFDLALINLCLPGINGFSLLKQLGQLASTIPVLIISLSHDLEDMEQAFNLGACGFISKLSSPEELQSAITSILSCGVYQPQQLAGFGQMSSWAKLHQITTRQTEVLQLVKKGKHNNEIAECLYITERTVKAHLTALFEIFGAKSRTELIYKVHQLGLD